MLKCGRKSTGSSAPGLQTASYPGVGGGGGGPAALLPGRHLYPYSSPKRSVWSQARWIWPQTPARSQQPDAVAPAPPKLLTHSFNSDSVSPHRWSAGQLRLHVPKPELSLFPSQPPPLLSSVHPAAQFRNVGVFPENPLPPHSLHASDSTSSLDWPSGPLCAHLCPPQQPPNCSVPPPPTLHTAAGGRFLVKCQSSHVILLFRPLQRLLTNCQLKSQFFFYDGV